MNTQVDKTAENNSRSAANTVSQKQSKSDSTYEFVDNRPEAVAQRKLQMMTNNSPKTKQLSAFQEMANKSQQTTQVTQLQSNEGVIQRVLILKRDGTPLVQTDGIFSRQLQNMASYVRGEGEVEAANQIEAEILRREVEGGDDWDLGPEPVGEHVEQRDLDDLLGPAVAAEDDWDVGAEGVGGHVEQRDLDDLL